MKVSEEEDINNIKHLVQSLLSSIPKAQIFKGKWSSIAEKLSDLNLHLSDLSDFPANSLSAPLLLSLSATLSDALSLSALSHSPSLPAGKLKTQNDIDSVSSRLSRHVDDIDILIKSGVLQDDAVSTPVSKRESVRVSSRSLITRLQIGSDDAKISAIESLNDLLQEDDKNVLIAVAQGIIPVVLRLLDSNSSPQLKENAVVLISRVSVLDSSKHVLIAEGLTLIQDLIRVLESGSGFAKEKACIVLEALSQTKENARAISSRGGIFTLLDICQGGTPNCQAVAASVLRNLSGFAEIREIFSEENGVLVLLGVLASGTIQAQENVIGCLCNLCLDDERLKLFVVKEGGVEFVMNYWDSVSNVRGLEVAVEFVRCLVSCHPIAEVIVSSGLLGRIVLVLNCNVLGVRVAAARAVYDMGYDMKTRKELGECGCIAPLVRMLDGKAVEEKEAAAKALAMLMGYAGNRRIFKKEERSIVSTVQLLNPLLKNFDRKYAVSILSSFVHSKRCRKQMIASSALVYLPKVVDMDVEGAKKLLESLGRRKLWGVFTGP
ncbi:hypothetical protein DCAR_0518716 [Daucus carota subsp. sativus]|uniref:Armadillo repeat-containing domain-containing protein n=1 Tax=Daucus carota subsp. sativus TaxID=79200 RepID=A0A164XFK9_DAUCS|nr:PREDICTED: ankyrin and armadillo repeat-containing protein [Daucus carota subsp. sativus]WOG99368.1 hypothetical protein DCAR_0518716 [Daucus carota subsp. sativus]